MQNKNALMADEGLLKSYLNDPGLLAQIGEYIQKASVNVALAVNRAICWNNFKQKKS